MNSHRVDSFDPQPLPKHSAPLPTARTSSPEFDNLLDPLLCLTPDKPSGPGRIPPANQLKPNRRGKNVRESLPISASKPSSGKVGCEADVKKEASRPVISSHPDVLFHQTRTKRKNEMQTQLQIIKDCAANGRHEKGRDERKNREDRITAKVNELARVSLAAHAASDAGSEKRPAILRPSGASLPGDGKKHVRIVDPKCPLSSPALHSTAVVGSQLRLVESQQFNAEEVLTKTLKESESARTAFNERVAESTNIDKGDKKYTGLVSVSLSVDDTLQKVVTQRLSGVKRKPLKPSKASEVPPPDILDLFSPSMIVESTNLDTSQLIPPKIKPEAMDPDTTFDLYRHMHCWNLGH